MSMPNHLTLTITEIFTKIKQIIILLLGFNSSYLVVSETRSNLTLRKDYCSVVFEMYI